MFLKRFFIFLILIIGIALIDYFYLGRPAIGIDDGNIFLTYARHLAAGEGFVFNSGGEKVEGFTSLLWVLICAFFYLITDTPELPIMIFLTLLTTLTVTLVYGEVKKDVEELNPAFSRKYYFWAFCAFLVCIGPSFIAWSVLTLMENAFWNFIFLSLILLLLSFYRSGSLTPLRKAALLATGIALILTRPESLLWGVFFTFLMALTEWMHRKRLRFALLFAVVLGATAAALTYFRLHYFGYPLPNTYYAKVSDDHLYNIANGAKYALSFITNFQGAITFLLVVLLLVCLANARLFLKQAVTGPETPRQNTLHRLIIISAIIVIGILLTCITGGDHFGGFRFYQGILLLFSWGIAALLWLYSEGILEKTYRQTRLLYLSIFFFFMLMGAGTLYNLKNPPKTMMHYEFILAQEGRDLAEDLNAYWHTAPPSVGVIAVGGFSLKYKGNTVDLMGLNNTLMGHSKGERKGIKNHAAFSKDVFYQLQPELLLPRVMANEKAARIQYTDFINPYNFENQAMKNIFNDPEFQQRYQAVLMSGKGHSIFTFVRRDRIPVLASQQITLLPIRVQ